MQPKFSIIIAASIALAASSSSAQPVLIPMQPQNVFVNSPLVKSSTGNNLTISFTGSLGTPFVPGTNLALTSGTLNAGTATLGSAAYTASTTYQAVGNYQTAFGLGNNLSLSGTILNAGSSVFGTAAYTASGSYQPAFTLGNNLTLSSGTLNAGSSAFGSAAYTASSTYQAAGNYVTYNLSGTGTITTSGSASLGRLSFDSGKIISDGHGDIVIASDNTLTPNAVVQISSTASNQAALAINSGSASYALEVTSGLTYLDNGAITTNGNGTMTMTVLGTGALVMADSGHKLASVGLGSNLSFSGSTLSAGTASFGSAAYTASGTYSPTFSLVGTNGIAITSSYTIGMGTIAASTLQGNPTGASAYPTTITLGNNLAFSSSVLSAGTATFGSAAYTASTGYVTSVTGSAPIASSGGATPSISLAVATSAANGYLASGDWTTFNNKQSLLTAGTNITISSGTISAGTATFGTGAYTATSTLVPYTGATGGVNLGSNFLTTSGTLGSGNFALAGTGSIGVSGSTNAATSLVVNGALGFAAATQVLSTSNGAVNWNNSAKQKVTLWNTGGTSTIAFTAPTQGQTSLQLILVQGSTASSTVTFTGGTIKWAGGTAYTPTNSAGAIDVISFLYDGTNYYGVVSSGFAYNGQDNLRFAWMTVLLPVAFVLRKRRTMIAGLFLLCCQQTSAATVVLGTSTSSATQATFSSGAVLISGPFHATSSGTVTKGDLWPGTAFSTKTFQLGLYASTTNTTTGTLLAQSATSSATQSQSNDVAMSAPIVSGSYYWIGARLSGTVIGSGYYKIPNAAYSVYSYTGTASYGTMDSIIHGTSLVTAASTASWSVTYTVASSTRDANFFGTVRTFPKPTPPLRIAMMPEYPSPFAILGDKRRFNRYGR
jgi:hypothetical protein